MSEAQTKLNILTYDFYSQLVCHQTNTRSRISLMTDMMFNIFGTTAENYVNRLKPNLTYKFICSINSLTMSFIFKFLLFHFEQLLLTSYFFISLLIDSNHITHYRPCS